MWEELLGIQFKFWGTGLDLRSGVMETSTQTLQANFPPPRTYPASKDIVNGVGFSAYVPFWSEGRMTCTAGLATISESREQMQGGQPIEFIHVGMDTPNTFDSWKELTWREKSMPFPSE